MKTKTNRTLRKILSIALCLALVMSYVPIVSITAGAAATDITVTIDTGASVTLRDADGDNYYDIGTADELYAFAAAVNDGNNDINGELTADIVVNENVLTETGELNGDGSNFRVWTPIGNDDNRYTGTFNGGRHTVRGLYFNNSRTYYVGLFGYVDDGGKVQNVGVIASYFNADEKVGGVAGCINKYSTVENCHNTSSVSGNYAVGGVVGSNSSEYSMVTNCYNTGTVTGNDESVGGIVGVNYGTITNCYNTGTVTGNYNVGGVVGFNGKYGVVNNCYNTGTIIGNDRNVGGVVGYNSKTNTVTNSYNTGSVSGNYNVGGVAGYNKGTVMNSYYLNGCATDGNNVTQFGVGNETVGSTTADVTGQTDSKSADWLASEELCAAVGYHQGAGAANGFCDLCGYDPATLNADGYYEISNAGQLFWFGNYINTVDRTANAVVTADIDLEGRALSPIGKAANKYQGVFDGQGHTISNFNMTITGAGNWGLFGYATGEGTVIKNFSISGDVTTALTSNVDVQYGVVGQADGGAEIRNVHSSVNLTSNDTYQKKYFGGIVGRTGNITVDMCSFSGKLSLGSNTLDCVGGIVGYVYNGKTAGITNCGFYGDIETTYSGGNVGGILGYYNGENAKALTISKCLSIGTLPEGREAIIGALKNYGSTNAGSENFYLNGLSYGISNVTATSVTQAQLESGEIAIALGDAWGQNINNRKTNQGYPVIDGATVYCVTNCLGNTDYSNTNATRHASGCILYNGAYSLCGEFGSAGIVDGVYHISTAEQLVSFAKTVNKGNTAINAKLINDIDLTGYEWTPVGTAENMYSGTFDGNGKSITIQFSYFGGNNDEKENYSLFAFIDGAEIRNLTVKGSIDVRGIYATGLVSQGYGNVIIENCISDVDITTRGIMAYASGLVGKVDGILNITNCAFTGSMSNPEQTFNSSGLVSDAQDTAEVYITNSYVAADFSDYIRLNFDSGETFVKGGGIVNLTNCYYMESLRGTPAYATQMTAEQFASGEVAYLLQQGNTEQVWGQDNNQAGATPVFDATGLYKVVTVGETGNYSVANVGDTNGDGTVDVTDYQALVNMAVSEGHSQTETASYDDIIRYDLVSDGYVDVLDAQLMALFVNGKETVDVYPVGDYDRNGKAFEEADIKAIKHAVENPERLATYKKYTSDINGDGKLDENDLTALTAKYGEITGTECADNVEVYYRWGNNYTTCTATAMCTICNKEVATETVETTSETLSELTCTEDGKVKYIAMFSDKLFDTKTTDVVTKTQGHSWTEWKTEIPATASSEGKEKRICSDCGETEERAIDKLVLEENVVAYYTVANDQVINLVNGEVMENATVDSDGYFRGGKVNLPSSYEKASIEAVMVYNRLSTDLPVGNELSYYGGAFLFQEAVNPSNWGLIKTPFGGGQIGTNFILRPSLNYNKRVMSDGESYWCLAFDKNETSYAMQINDDYVEKEHWSNYINSTFTLSAEHQFKEFIVYSEKLTRDEMADHFTDNKISLSADTNTIVGRVNNGITGLGSAFAFTKKGQDGVPEWYDTNIKAGDYSVNDGNGMTLKYTISDYVEPDLGIDHSKYESVHIIKKPETLPVGYKYALSAVPYPFNVNHDGSSDQYDVSWKSSDETVALVIDGMVIPQKAGTVTITATLRGTEISDSCTIEIINKNATKDNALKISANYISENGNSFSQNDYVMTTNAIYDAITEAYEDGYNHVIFPEIDFYAVPTETEFYIPSGMTVEFPEGSVFHMMPSELAKTEGYTYFRMGWGWWSCTIPTEKASVEKDENGNVLAYYCRNSHLIIDKYYGEFYEEDAAMSQLYSDANQYQWNCNLLSIGKRAEFCSVEVREANCPTGFFITMGGKGNSELVNGAQGSIAANEFVSGWLNDSGDLVESSDWISTTDFYSISKAANGMDTLHEYYIGNWEHNLIVATQRLYDILWYDKDYNLISANRWQYVDEGYANKPENAVYFKLSIQQSELPDGTDEYVRICPDESSRFCEIKNTKIINSAVGLASVVGATEACWIHDNYVSGDGLLYGGGRSLDLEDGWAGMRGTIIERNIFRKYGYSGSSDYRGPDTGVLALASGYNTFVVSNYIGAIQQSNYNVANTHIINNVVYSMYSSFTNGSPNDIRSKINSHVYYNILGQKSNEISSNGVNYYHENTIIPSVNVW